MINVYCRTNLDDYKNEKWPCKMAVRPIKGDRVTSENGLRLTVVDVTHVIAKDGWSLAPEGEPYLIVELHKGYREGGRDDLAST